MVWDLLGGFLDWLTPDVGVPGPGWFPADMPVLGQFPFVGQAGWGTFGFNGQLPFPPEWIAYSWRPHSASPVFYRLKDGRIATQTKKGVWKIWRPRFHNPAAPPKKVRKAAARFLSAAKQWDKVDVVKKKAKRYKKKGRRR